MTESPLKGFEVKILKDEDYEQARHLVEDTEKWSLVYKKKQTEVWTQEMPESTFKMIKTKAVLNVSAEVVYDVLHDPDYRSTWDKYMVKSEDIGILNTNNDLCYYAPIVAGYGEPEVHLYEICLARCKIIPPSKTFIRGFIYLTVYYIKVIDDNSCEVTYLTHSDPKGKLPSWLINHITKIIAPKVLKKLHKACVNYESWKRHNKPLQKPWRYPEQLEAAPRADLAKCMAKDVVQELVDETGFNPEDLNDD
ncbi:unnamed protein product [Bursaphelenchus okinawaensis]|uniref:START domain-containing protein n=1 Tax=Bursaphelenchus okinawaensis TaxID=465554 RepID=A0A811KIW9_9BILA|nr:unnamed protein product [Bursaphelenchus okinawaensis]CAG9103764.1 unnamed protein product [Bursaphelenchus okinawaensis]